MIPHWFKRERCYFYTNWKILPFPNRCTLNCRDLQVQKYPLIAQRYLADDVLHFRPSSDLPVTGSLADKLTDCSKGGSENDLSCNDMLAAGISKYLALSQKHFELPSSIITFSSRNFWEWCLSFSAQMSLLMEYFRHKTVFEEFISMNNIQAYRTNFWTGNWHIMGNSYISRKFINSFMSSKESSRCDIRLYLWKLMICRASHMPLRTWIFWKKTQKLKGCRPVLVWFGFFVFCFVLFLSCWPETGWTPRNLSSILI